MRPRKSRTAQTAPTLVRAARGAGRKRTGACQDLNLGLPRGNESYEREIEARQQRHAGDAAKPLGGQAPAGHMRRAGAGICTSRATGAISVRGWTETWFQGFIQGVQ